MNIFSPEVPKERRGDLRKGGMVRGPGEPELIPGKPERVTAAPKVPLSGETEEQRKLREAYDANTIKFLGEFLAKKGWDAGTVLQNTELREKLAGQLPSNFLRSRLPEYLERLVKREKAA